MKLALFVFLLVAVSVIQAQTPAPQRFAISGIVTDAGLSRPLPDVEIKVSEFVRTPYKVTEIGKKQTDNQGAFRFEVENAATYVVQVSKPGYSVVGGDSNVTLDVNKDHPNGEARFQLYSTGELTGRVVDDETDMPVAGFHVNVVELVYHQGEAAFVGGPVTPSDENGRFIATDRRPGNYLVQVRRQSSEKERVRTQFTSADAEKVDSDYASAYWPGGPRLDSASPVRIPSGGSASAGIIRVKRTNFYRVRVSLPAGACEPGQKIAVITEMLQFHQSAGGDVDCSPEYLLTGYPPGGYLLYLLDGTGAAHRMRVIVPFQVSDRNLEIKVPLVRGPDIGGRVLLADGAKGPVPPTIRVALRTAEGPVEFSDERTTVTPEESGAFRIAEVPLAKQRVVVTGVGRGYYVKEIRYNGIPLTDRVFATDGGSAAQSLDIVVDDKPATISGSVTDHDKPDSTGYIALVPWPVSPANIFLSTQHTNADDHGQYRFTGLPPGAYRILAIPRSTTGRLDEPNVLFRLMDGAQRVSVDQGSSQIVELKLTDPDR